MQRKHKSDFHTQHTAHKTSPRHDTKLPDFVSHSREKELHSVDIFVSQLS